MEIGTRRATRRLIAALFVTFALTEGVCSLAQAPAESQIPSSSRPVLLKEGTEMKLKLRDNITSKTAVEGDSVNLILDQDLKVGEITVARAGSVVVGTISHASKAGMLGRPGDLGLRLITGQEDNGLLWYSVFEEPIQRLIRSSSGTKDSHDGVHRCFPPQRP